MAEGFRYNGVHIEDMHCQYVPDADVRGDVMGAYTVHDEDMDGRNGGVWFATTVKPRVFNLACVYEEITLAQREEILNWLDRRTSGELIFDDRPYAVYTVRPTERVRFEDYSGTYIDGVEKHSGVFTIQFTAYCPFAKLVANSIPMQMPDDEEQANAINRMKEDIMLLPSEQMPSSPSLSTRSFLLYNCGTENAHTVIKLAGTIGENGMLIMNTTTGQRCKVGPITAAETTDLNKRLAISSEMGKVEMIGSVSTELAFEYHDYGYITLAPSTAYTRDITMTYSSGQQTITSNGQFKPYMEGQYVYVGSDWFEIAKVNSKDSATLSSAPSGSGTVHTPVVTMNRIIITGDNINLTELSVDYTARVR